MSIGLRAPRRRWTHAEYDRLEQMIAVGASMRRAADTVGRSYESVRVFRYRVRERRSTVANHLWTISGVIRLLGTHYRRVEEWIDDGLLAVAHGTKYSRKHWRISESAHHTFMADRRAWMDWTSAGITDPVWRAEAERLRAEAGGDWLTAKQVVQRLAWHPATVRKWCSLGILEATKHRVAWYIWSADLDGFVPPEGLPRGRKPKVVE